MAAYTSSAQSFDKLAPRYDTLVESNPIHRYLRARSIAWLDEAFGPGMRVLELGCGTGYEAIHLAQRGVEIVASDISRSMVEATRSRARASGVERKVRVEQCPAGRIGVCFAGEKFDGAFASFGALNCEPDLSRAIGQVASVVREGGNFLLSVVSRPCAPEIALASAQLQFRRAFRRMRRTTRVDLYGFGSVDAQTYSEDELRRSLEPAFAVDRIEGWLIVLPPPSAVEACRRVRSLSPPVESIEARLRATWPFRGWGDHLHIWARRRS